MQIKVINIEYFVRLFSKKKNLSPKIHLLINSSNKYIILRKTLLMIGRAILPFKRDRIEKGHNNTVNIMFCIIFELHLIL